MLEVESYRQMLKFKTACIRVSGKRSMEVSNALKVRLLRLTLGKESTWIMLFCHHISELLDYPDLSEDMRHILLLV